MHDLRHEHRHLEVACELGAGEVGARAIEWRRLREEAGLGSESISGGARLWLRREAFDSAADLVRREAACCGFLDLELMVVDDRLRLDITSPATYAAPVIASLAGLDPGA